MALLTLRDVSLSFGGPLLLDHANLTIEPGERIALLGRNGTGKSSLLKVLAGTIKVDDGEISQLKNLRCAYLSQEVPANIEANVFDTIALGLGDIGHTLSEYQHVINALSDDHSDKLLNRLDRLHRELDELDAWKFEQKVSSILTRMELDGQALMANLSGGMRRRVWLAKELISEPDLLLLDEPTNHLDITNIQWLESFLKDYNGTLIMISHDRAFVQRIATRIIELDRGRLSSWECDFNTYLVRREQALEAEANQNKLFDKKLSQEETWIRQGIKARRTRNEGRVRALKRLREEHQARRELLAKAKINVQEAIRSGKIVAEVDHIDYAIQGNTIISDFTATISRGDKIGIIGPNGSGKTTLIKLILGYLKPDSGTVKHGTQLEIAFFDQLRQQLNEELSVIENVGEGSTRIEINNQSKHIIGYLQDFLFTPDRAQTPVKALSGGERNRLLLAKLFTKPANVLVLDEPTNDLDVETLELLEDLLLNFNGTIILVSHDRAFLNNVVTSTFVIDETGHVHDYVGNYDDAMRQREAESLNKIKSQPSNLSNEKIKKKNKSLAEKKPEKLSYKDQRELQDLPVRIEQLETALETLHQQLADPEFYKSTPEFIAQTNDQLGQYQHELDQAFKRWEVLENK